MAGDEEDDPIALSDSEDVNPAADDQGSLTPSSFLKEKESPKKKKNGKKNKKNKNKNNNKAAIEELENNKNNVEPSTPTGAIPSPTRKVKSSDNIANHDRRMKELLSPRKSSSNHESSVSRIMESSIKDLLYNFDETADDDDNNNSNGKAEDSDLMDDGDEFALEEGNEEDEEEEGGLPISDDDNDIEKTKDSRNGAGSQSSSQHQQGNSDSVLAVEEKKEDEDISDGDVPSAADDDDDDDDNNDVVNENQCISDSNVEVEEKKEDEDISDGDIPPTGADDEGGNENGAKHSSTEIAREEDEDNEVDSLGNDNEDAAQPGKTKQLSRSAPTSIPFVPRLIDTSDQKGYDSEIEEDGNLDDDDDQEEVEPAAAAGGRQGGDLDDNKSYATAKTNKTTETTKTNKSFMTAATTKSIETTKSTKSFETAQTSKSIETTQTNKSFMTAMSSGASGNKDRDNHEGSESMDDSSSSEEEEEDQPEAPQWADNIIVARRSSQRSNRSRSNSPESSLYSKRSRRASRRRDPGGRTRSYGSLDSCCDDERSMDGSSHHKPGGGGRGGKMKRRGTLDNMKDVFDYEGSYVLVLCSHQNLNHEAITKHLHCFTLLEMCKIPYETLYADGDEPHNKRRTEELCAISGRKEFPQFFIVDGRTTTYFGDYCAFEASEFRGTLRQDMGFKEAVIPDKVSIVNTEDDNMSMGSKLSMGTMGSTLATTSGLKADGGKSTAALGANGIISDETGILDSAPPQEVIPEVIYEDLIPIEEFLTDLGEQPKFLVLSSKKCLTREYVKRQIEAFKILDEKRIWYQKVNADEMANSKLRDELYALSGKRGEFPQFFLHYPKEKMKLIYGDWERFNECEQAGKLESDLIFLVNGEEKEKEKLQKQQQEIAEKQAAIARAEAEEKTARAAANASFLSKMFFSLFKSKDKGSPPPSADNQLRKKSSSIHDNVQFPALHVQSTEAINPHNALLAKVLDLLIPLHIFVSSNSSEASEKSTDLAALGKVQRLAKASDDLLTLVLMDLQHGTDSSSFALLCLIFTVSVRCVSVQQHISSIS